MAGGALAIRTDLYTPAALRRWARRERERRAAMRMLALANALEGMRRAEAARLAGMERQALRDAVVRYNAEGLAGLRDRPKPGRTPRLTAGERATLRAVVLRGPDPACDGGGDWTLPMLCRRIRDQFGKTTDPDVEHCLRKRSFSETGGFRTFPHGCRLRNRVSETRLTINVSLLDRLTKFLIH
jgi:transposase